MTDWRWEARRARVMARVADAAGVLFAGLYVWVLLGLATPFRAVAIAAILPARFLALRYRHTGARGSSAFYHDAHAFRNGRFVCLRVPAQRRESWWAFLKGVF